MKFIDGELPILELTRRNLTVLLAKLDDPHSLRSIIDPDNQIMVRAVEDADHYANRAPGTNARKRRHPMNEDIYEPTYEEQAWADRPFDGKDDLVDELTGVLFDIYDTVRPLSTGDIDRILAIARRYL